MITRTARGHTGRPIKASMPEVLAVSLIGAAVAWSAAFLICLWIFTPWLMSTRLDGKDG